MKISKKVCLIGDFAVGKTSLVRRFVYDLFDDKYLSTIGVKVSRKRIFLNRTGGETVELTMMLWDLAGSEEFTQVRASYLRGAAGALLVCDLTRPETLDSLGTYAQDLWSVNHAARVVLAANKQDLVAEREIEAEHLQAVAAELGAFVCLTSAKTGHGVEEAFHHLGDLLIAGS